MKIAMIGHKHIPSREGGIEVVVEELSTRMVKLGHSVTCFNRKGRHVSGGEIEKLKEYKGVKIKEGSSVSFPSPVHKYFGNCRCKRCRLF